MADLGSGEMQDSERERQRRIQREAGRLRARLRRECERHGASPDEPLRRFSEAAAEALPAIDSGTAPEQPESAFRQRVRQALQQALAAGRDAMRPDELSSFIPANSDAALLEDVLIGVESLLVLIERGVYRRPYAPQTRLGEREPDAPVHRWRGADVRIAESPYPGYSGSSTLVVTEHAAALAGLLYDLRDLAAPALDYMTKYEYFGRIAEAANAWIVQHPETDRMELLLAATHEARSVVEDWQARVAERQGSLWD